MRLTTRDLDLIRLLFRDELARALRSGGTSGNASRSPGEESPQWQGNEPNESSDPTMTPSARSPIESSSSALTTPSLELPGEAPAASGPRPSEVWSRLRRKRKPGPSSEARATKRKAGP
jgi:hypothetical protein